MESKNSSLLLKSSLCLAHTIHIPDFWLEIRLNMDVLYVRTFTTANFLYLTAPLQPMLQAGFLRWYLFRCDYLLIYNETLGGKVLILSNLTSIYERKYFKARNILNLFALMLRMALFVVLHAERVSGKCCYTMEYQGKKRWLLLLVTLEKGISVVTD